MTKRCEGTLVLVVGPSGAGKDTLINAGRRALADDPRFVFVRRTITREAAPESEDHLTLAPAEFERVFASGRFALVWRAHGLSYGLPCSIVDDLVEGRIVVANASRSIVADARALPGRVVAVHVTAPPEVLASRLRLRGRESPESIAERIIRAASETVPADAIEIRNNGSIDAAVETFIALLRHQSENHATAMTP